MKTGFLLSILFCCFSAFAMEDSAENRLKEAQRYVATTPPEEVMIDMANNMSMNLPPEERKEFRELFVNYVNMQALADAMIASMVKTFTADELAALADFYERPIAKSAMKKMGIYMADAMPTIQTELINAMAKMEEDKAAQNRLLPDIEDPDEEQE